MQLAIKKILMNYLNNLIAVSHYVKSPIFIIQKIDFGKYVEF